MPEEQTNIILTELKGFRELMEEKFKNVEKRFDDSVEHFEKLNGQTSKNTKFRWAGSAVIGFLLIVIPLILKYK